MESYENERRTERTTLPPRRYFRLGENSAYDAALYWQSAHDQTRVPPDQIIVVEEPGDSSAMTHP